MKLEKKVVSGIMLTLLLTSMLMLAFNIQPVRAEPATIIVPDDYPTIQAAVNAASPGDTIIVRKGTYTENVKINKDHLTIKSKSGAEVTIVQAANPNDHVFEITADCVNLNGFTIKGGHYGIFVYDCASSAISENIVTNNVHGIHLWATSGNLVTDNTAIQNTAGVILWASGDNRLRNNQMLNNEYNFGVGSGDGFLFHFVNDIDTSNKVDGKAIYYWVGRDGGQIPADAGYVAVVNSKNVIVKNLILERNMYGVLFAYTTFSQVEDIEVHDIGYDAIHLVSSHNNRIIENAVSEGGWNAVFLWQSSGNIISHNSVTKTTVGFRLHHSTDNVIISNTLSEDNTLAVYLEYLSGGNKFYHNNFYCPVFIWTETQAGLTNFWDNGYPSGGNYWSDYTGSDHYSGPNQDLPGSDGIGDTPYIIDEYNRDRYPLMKPWPPAAKILSVPYYFQGLTDWCVPTSMSMIFKYYNQNIHSWDIAKDWGWGRDLPLFRLEFWEPTPGMVRKYFNAHDLTTEDGPVDFDTIRAWIDARAPVLVWAWWTRWKWPPIIGHMVVIVGYSLIAGSEKVYINDPSGTLVGEFGSFNPPYIAVELDWNDVVGYVTSVMAVRGMPNPPKGTIDLSDDDRGLRFWHELPQGPPDIYSWLDKGLIWKRNEDHALALDSGDYFEFYQYIDNHMEGGQTYVLEIEFATERAGLQVVASKIWFTVSVKGRDWTYGAYIMNPIPLRGLLTEYGEYTITLRLWDEHKKLMYDEVVFPSIEYSPGLMFYLPSPADLYITDPQGLHVGVDPSTGQVVNEISGAVYTGPGSEPQVIAIPDPLDGNYEVQLIGTATGTYSLTTELITLQQTVTQTYSGEIVEDAVYVYDVSIADEVMTVNPDPVTELEHLKEFIMDLPDDVFVTDDPDEFVEFKKEMVDKIDETLEELSENKYTEAIEKLNDIKEEVMEEEKLQPTTQSDLCLIIDHIISSIETLQQA